LTNDDFLDAFPRDESFASVWIPGQRIGWHKSSSGNGQNPIAKKGKTREETLDILDLVGQYNNLTQL